MLGWREHPAAREEFLDAVDWHEDQAPGLGSRFVGEADAGLEFIRRWPEATAPHGRGRIPQLRRKGMSTFPYGIIYFVRDNEIVVVVYAHARRRPGYWRMRLADL